MTAINTQGQASRPNRGFSTEGVSYWAVYKTSAKTELVGYIMTAEGTWAKDVVPPDEVNGADDVVYDWHIVGVSLDGNELLHRVASEQVP